MKKNNFGRWSCTLVTETGNAFGGKLVVENEVESIYFVTQDGVKCYSLDTAEVKTVVNRREFNIGVAYDWLRDKIYWSCDSQVFRANTDGSQVEKVLDNANSLDDIPYGLAFDWVSGNIYVVSDVGLIIACNGTPTKSFTCATVLQARGRVQGIALDPVTGKMYWTQYSAYARSSVLRSKLDGTNPVTLVAGLLNPHGIAIDFSSNRLYWADTGANRIQSSDLQGRDVQMVYQLPHDSCPYGVAVVGTRIYWSTRGTQKLQSGSKTQGQIITHYNDTNTVYHLAVTPSIG